MENDPEFDYCDFPEEDQQGCLRLFKILFAFVLAVIICGIISLCYEYMQ